MKSLVFLLALTSAAYADVPTLFDVELGSKYPFSSPFPVSNDKPTMQFKAPNTGDTAKLFPEYEIAALHGSGEVVIVSARRVFETIAECQSAAKALRPLVAKRFEALRFSEARPNFSAEDQNVFINIQCMFQGDGAPFPTLEYQARGKEQDVKLKQAWAKYFGEKR